MNFRTITVLNTEGEPLNAVLLCGFSATGAERRFVVYSLNEKLGGGLVRIYLASLCDEQNELLMACVSPVDYKMAAHILKSIISDALVSPSQMSDGSYQLLDLLKARIIPGDVHTHRSLKVNEAWVEKLLSFQPATERSARKTTATSIKDIHIELECTDYYSKLTPVNRDQNQTQSSPLTCISREPDSESAIVQTTKLTPSTDPIKCEEIQPMTENTASRIEKNLQTLIANLSNHKEALQSKHEEFYSARLEQERRDRDLAIREAVLDQRENELNKNSESLAIAEAQLSELINIINDASSYAEVARSLGCLA